MRGAAATRAQLADEDKALSYLAILDVSQAANTSFDLDALRYAVELDTRLLKFLIVGVNLQARILVEHLMKITPTKVEIAYSVGEALARARALSQKSDADE